MVPKPTHSLMQALCLSVLACLTSPCLLAPGPVFAQETAPAASTEQAADPPKASGSDVVRKLSGLAASVSYGKNGFEFKTDDNTFSLNILNRIQFRYANPFDSDPRSLSDLSRSQSSFMIRRARTKLNGQAYWPWLKFTLQFDWRDLILRDLNLMVDKFEFARLFVGRGKVVYNDERMTSSSRQQFVNRSIVNDLFTVDRHDGLQLSGHVFADTPFDLTYNVGIFNGVGVGERSNDDGELMYAGRLQWNALGGELAFSQSDVEMHADPVLSLAVAGATNQSKCTAFATSTDGCRALPGFEIGKAGQFRINQLVEELRFRWMGLSLNHELHWKQVNDTLKPSGDAGSQTDMLGSLVQAGYFPHGLLPFIPKQLELAGRYAFVDPHLTRSSDMQHEFSGVLNYFFHGHNNKISLQLSHLIVQDPATQQSQAAQRLWLQWDLSF